MCNAFGVEIRARMHVFHLLAVGALSFDPRQEPISDQTLIYPGGVITWDPFDSVWAPNGCSTGGPGVWSANSPPTASSLAAPAGIGPPWSSRSILPGPENPRNIAGAVENS
jgi:hypothetical protein